MTKLFLKVPSGCRCHSTPYNEWNKEICKINVICDSAVVVSGIFIVKIPSYYNVSCRATAPGLVVGELLKESKYGSGFPAPPWHTSEPKEEIKRNNRTFGRYCKMLFARKGMMCRPLTKTEAQPVWSSKPGGGDSVKTILSRMMILEKTSLSNHYDHPLPLKNRVYLVAVSDLQEYYTT